MSRRRKLGAVAAALVAGWSACVLAVVGARWFWPGEMLAGFDWHLGLAGLALASAGALLRWRAAAAAVAVGALPMLWPSLRLWTHASPEPHGTALELTTGNIQWMNDDLVAIEAWLREEDSDVYTICEVSKEHLPMFARLADRWPHQWFTTPPDEFSPGTWATAILSRLPFEATDRVPIVAGPAEDRDPDRKIRPERWLRPVLEATVLVEGRPLIVRNVHPMRPGQPHRLYDRARVLDTLAARRWPAASLLAGDLNLPPASPAFRDLLARTGLRDSRPGFGRQPSYPADATRLIERLLPPLVAIDHVLVGNGLVVLERRTGTIPGSDHLAVTATLALRSVARSEPGG